MGRLCGNANDTAGRSWAGVASLLALLVPAFTEIIGSRVDDDGALYYCQSLDLLKILEKGQTYSENAVLADQLDKAVADAAFGIALGIGLEVAQVTDMAFRIGRATVGLAVGVVWSHISVFVSALFPRLASLRTVRAGAGASVGVVSELMDVDATLGIGVVAGDVPGDGSRRGFGGLLEGHLSSDLGVSSDDGN